MNQLSKGVLHDKTQVFREAYRGLKCAGVWDYLKRPTHYNGNDWLDACQLLACLRVILGAMGILRCAILAMEAVKRFGYLNCFDANIRVFSDGRLVRFIRGECADCGFYSAIPERGEYSMVHQYALRANSEGWTR